MEFIADGIFQKKDFLNKELLEYIQNEFHEETTQIIIQKLSNYLDKFIDNLWIYIEYPYVDKLYRSSYYMYYSAKYQTYNRNCFRLSFFNQPVTVIDFFNKQGQEKLQESFLGFMVLRPTIPQLIGRNILSPLILKNQEFECCLMKEEVTIKGVKLTVHGFPHESQDGEFSTCAETSIWSLVEYFSHKYADYKTILLSDITKTLNDDAIERVTPSQGLSYYQISWILKKFGFDPKTYFVSKQNEKVEKIDDNLKKVLFTYIDSGIPVIGGLRFIDDNSSGHAIVIIGKSEVNIEEIRVKLSTLPAKYYNLYDLVEECSIVTIDDNMPPYNVVSFLDPTANYFKKASVITEIVAPLYPKMNLEATQAIQNTDFFLNNTFQTLLTEVFKEERSQQSSIYKLLLSSSRSFKAFIAKLENVDSDIKILIVGISMPKFIWIVEVTNIDLMDKNKINGFIIFDATASTIQVLCIILDGRMTFDNGENWTECPDCGILPAYKNNLKGKWNLWKM